MRAPYGLEPSESCRSCKFRRNGFFCQVSPVELRDLDAVKFVSVFPAGALLFVEQQRSRGIYILCEGLAKLSFNSSEGKTLILDIAQPGDVLGLFPAVSGTPYEVTAQTLRPSQVAFIGSRDFQDILEKHPSMLERVSHQFGLQYETACEQLRRVGLGTSVFEKVARFLLAWSVEKGASGDAMPFELSLSHQEIGEYVGISRESVTRALCTLRYRGLIKSYGKTSLIPSRARLEEVRDGAKGAKGASPRLVPLTPMRPISSAAVRQPASRQAVHKRKSA